MLKILFLISWALWMFSFVPPSQLQSTQRSTTTADPELSAKIDRLLENQVKMDRLLENQVKMDRLLENQDKMVENQDKMSADLKSCGGAHDGESERTNEDSSCPSPPIKPNTDFTKFRCDGLTDSSTESGVSTLNINGRSIRFYCDRETEFYPFTDWIVFLRRVDGQVIFHL